MPFSSLVTRFIFHRITRNIAFWLLASLFYLKQNTLLDYTITFVVLSVSYGLPAYINNDWLIQRFLLRRQPVRYFIALVLLVCLTMTVAYYIDMLSYTLFPYLYFPGMRIYYYAWPTLTYLSLLAFGKFITDTLEDQRKKEQEEHKRLESELETLRSQVNPHFLFNALNTIYGLSLRSDESESSAAIMKLSNILRYVLYECNVPFIPLQKEIQLLQQFTEFAILRMHHKDQVQLRLDAQIEDQTIAPLLLLPFIENALKHGFTARAQDLYIHIDLKLQGNDLYFHCTNNKAPAAAGVSIHNGIGLRNVRRRLEILYPSRHKLNILEASELFKVELHLILT